MKKQMEGDNRQRRAKAKEARDEGRQASEDGVTTGASNQRRSLPNRAEHEERLTGSGWGKQQPEKVARQPKPRRGRNQTSGTATDDAFAPQGDEVTGVEPGELTGTDEVVFQSIVLLEDVDSAPTLNDIAGETGLSPDETEPALQRLIGRHDVVQELPADDEVGNRYRVKSR